MEIKKVIRWIVTLIIVLIMIGITLLGAMAFSIDSDDNLIMSVGETIESSFIIVDYPDAIITINSNFDWLSLKQSSYVKNIVVSSEKNIGDKGIFIPYYITIPKETDVGIYRTIIEVEANDEVKVVNIKISVQNKFVRGIHQFFSSVKTKIYLLTLFIVSTLTTIFIYRKKAF